MELKNVKEMLEKYDIEAEEITVNKNGIPVKGLIVGHDAIRPTIYEHTVKDLDEMEVLHLVNDALMNPMISEVDTSKLLDKDFILDNVYCAIRHRTDDESIIKINFKDDLEIYFYISLIEEANGTRGTVKVKSQILDNTGISCDELVEAAKSNTKKTIDIVSMSSMLSSMTGEDYPSDFPLYVATNDRRFNGAVAMYFEDILNDFCLLKGFKEILIIPSSIHECLIIPATDDSSVKELCNMIKEVNQTTVSEFEQLSDHPYCFTATVEV